MNLEELQAKLDELTKELTEIQAQLNSEETNEEEKDLDEVEERAKTLIEERKAILNEIKEKEEKIDARNSLKREIAEGTVETRTIRKYEEKTMENKELEFRTKEEALRSEAYESAFAKRFVMENPEYTEAEKRALDTTNGAVLIPHKWLDEVIDDIKEAHTLLSDLTWNNISQIIEIPRRLSIVSGDAAVVEEGTCAPGEENEFDSVQVDLVEVKKMLEITSKMGQLLPEAFKTWLMGEVRDRIGHQIAVVTVEAIKDDILKENKITGEATLANVLKAFAVADSDNAIKVYANRKTLYTSLFGLQGTSGQDAFVSNPSDPLRGTLLGAELGVESALPDNEILVVAPSDVFLNVPGGIRVKSLEDDCFNIKISGVALVGARLKYRKGAALLTITPAA